MIRPLVRYKYISKRKDGLYGPLAKAFCEHDIKPFVTVNSSKEARERAAKISKISALFISKGIPTRNGIPAEGENAFIPSPVWRKIKLGLISTTRFLGVLFYKGLLLAVYDIDDENMEWQLYAEGSLLFDSYFNYKTAADGLLFLCQNNGTEIGRKIIKRTLWNEKRLIKDENYFYEEVKQMKWSKSPIRIKSTYNSVLLAEYDDVIDILEAKINSDTTIETFAQKNNGEIIEPNFKRTGDVEIYPHRYYINLENDLLKFIFCYTHTRDLESIRHHMIIPEKYKPLGDMLECDVQYV